MRCIVSIFIIAENPRNWWWAELGGSMGNPHGIKCGLCNKHIVVAAAAVIMMMMMQMISLFLISWVLESVFFFFQIYISIFQILSPKSLSEESLLFVHTLFWILILMKSCFLTRHAQYARRKYLGLNPEGCTALIKKSFPVNGTYRLKYGTDTWTNNLYSYHKPLLKFLIWVSFVFIVANR